MPHGPNVLDTIKRNMQIREIKIAKKGERQITRDDQGSGAGTASPDPLASGASSASPDPSWAQAQTPPRPSPHLGARLPTHDGRTLDRTYAVIPILRQGMAASVPTTPATVQPYLFHCEVPSHSKRGMGEINQYHFGCPLLLLQDMQQYH